VLRTQSPAIASHDVLESGEQHVIDSGPFEDRAKGAQELGPESNKLWDYAVGVANPRQPDSAAWLEVHPASSLHVDEVLAKLRWLKQWLESGAPELDQLPRRFCWIATGAVSFDRGSRQARRIAQAGLRFPVKHVDLERVFAD